MCTYAIINDSLAVQLPSFEALSSCLVGTPPWFTALLTANTTSTFYQLCYYCYHGLHNNLQLPTGPRRAAA